MLNIISKSYCSRLTSGPRKVAVNLIKGLDILGYPYVINKRPDACRRLWIHDDIEALKQLQNLDGNIKVLAGPNLFILPEEISSAADLSRAVYIQNSEWVKNMWLDRGFNSCPIEVWPVGIDTAEFAPNAQKKDIVTVYFKQRPEGELKTVEEVLNKKNIKFKILRYGSYSENAYKDALAHSRYIIWLGIHESQGIALEEALAANVPALVCDMTQTDRWGAAGVSKLGQKPYTVTSSAPYFSDSCGIKIGSLGELSQALEKMEDLSRQFEPRKYILEHLDLKKQSQAFLEIYHKHFGLTLDDGFKEVIQKKGDWVNNGVLAKAKFLFKDLYKSIQK